VRPAAIRPRAAGVKLLGERLDTKLLEAGGELRICDEEGLTEATWIGEPELAAVVKLKASAQVALRGRSARPRRAASPRRGRSCSSPSTRTRLPVIRQVHDQGLPAGRAPAAGTCPPPEPFDRPARHAASTLDRRAPAATSARRAPEPLDPRPRAQARGCGQTV
jgi:hypothetical protein